MRHLTRSTVDAIMANHWRWSLEYPGFYAMRLAPDMLAGIGDPMLYAGTDDGIQVWLEPCDASGKGTGEQRFAEGKAQTPEEALAAFDALVAEVYADRLAEGFRKVLASWLMPAELARIDALNKASGDPLICASHDFCDANMAMHESFVELIGRTPADDVDCEGSARLWNTAWDRAKAKGFAAPL